MVYVWGKYMYFNVFYDECTHVHYSSSTCDTNVRCWLTRQHFDQRTGWVSECVGFNVPLVPTQTNSNRVETKHHTQHIIGHFRDDFYRPDDQTNSVKALKETSWLSRSHLNPSRTTPPCYNNTTLGNRLIHTAWGSQCDKPNLFDL